MPIKFIIDTREKAIQKLFTLKNIKYEIKQLDLGDILIQYSKNEIKETVNLSDNNLSDKDQKLLRIKKHDKEDKKENDKDDNKKDDNNITTFVIERKSYKDLKASMSDNRYREQKSRYLQLPKNTCFYILENNDPEFEELGRKQFVGTYIHTMIRDKLGVFLTNSIEETVEFLIKIGETLETYGVNIDVNTNLDSNSTQIKKKKCTGKEVYIQQLCCIPGISKGKAEIIAKEYEDFSSLLQAINNNNFKIKGIGKVLLQNITESLLYNSNRNAVEDKEMPKKTKSTIIFDEE